VPAAAGRARHRLTAACLLPKRATGTTLDWVTERPVASILRQLREERGASLRAAASDLGIAPSHLSRLERGQKGASPEVAQRAADYYGINPDELGARGVPADVAQILRDHPEAIEELRRRYAT
jgi:transcriptional regulator with XRE-family HTH domain